ncbi:MAG: CHAT domain-containing protein [Saprospiraceae bacterium]|nr:CHAT domain-containing protein [Saprospiraceae bacterium]
MVISFPIRKGKDKSQPIATPKSRPWSAPDSCWPEPIKPGRKASRFQSFEDGILTAFEISQLNLTNTELVVLSACETGLGDIQGSEGVFGLQRAFKMAGVRYLIMSLWQVPDFQTQDLMTTFYAKWLEQGLPIPEAFRAAQLEMRDKYQSPYFWAGFVLVE